MKYRDLMRDPFYAGLMYFLESGICDLDRRAKEAGITLADSQIQSALVKLEKVLQGKNPGIPQESPRDRLLAEWIEDNRQPPVEAHKAPVSTGDRILAVLAVLDSLKLRRSQLPGSRNYLDFLQDFIRQASDKNPG